MYTYIDKDMCCLVFEYNIIYIRPHFVCQRGVGRDVGFHSMSSDFTICHQISLGFNMFHAISSHFMTCHCTALDFIRFD